MLGVKINCNKDINVTEIGMHRMSQTSIMRFTLSIMRFTLSPVNNNTLKGLQKPKIHLSRTRIE